MSTALTIAGGALELVGLVFVFAELAVLSSQSREASIFLDLLNRPRDSLIVASDTLGTSDSTRRLFRAGPAEPGPPQIDRIVRLEHNVERLDRDIESLGKQLADQRDAAIAESKRQAEKVRDEIEVRELERRIALRRSVVRQRLGGACVLLGLILGTLGNVL